ncbi:E3 ubiquitin-protein ligase ZNF598-like [Salvia hispanica]|uniref:E3 ubiquitin-protein ligase ZNF598-like n=1 Tax=Salvia hispanica TaxID=49212 RepID=UPI002009794A|nr:E3 ubiquitin-protein ligase ZNF598-like [Salvia hispanica]
MDDSCAVCAESLEWVAYGSCGHKDVCSTCVARLRFICNDRSCCICKTDNDVVFVTKALGNYTKTIGDFTLFPAERREGKMGQYWYHDDTQAFFDDSDHYKMIKAMCRLSCSECDKEDQLDDGSRRRAKFRNIDQLKGHLFHKHRLIMCSLCLEGRKVFVCEQKLYTRSQLSQHISTGDSAVDGTESERGGFSGHPPCEFCQTPFYGDNELYTHMETEHYTCHICRRQHPGEYEYYGNYDNLEIHFRRDHFLCEDESCLAKKFVVFTSESEIKRHNTIEHGGRMSRSQRSAALQIPTSFRYRRSSDQENRRGRARSFRRDLADELSMAIQASLETASATPPNSRASNDHGESADADSLISPLESLGTTDPELPSRYRQAVSQSSISGTLGDSAFPPLAAGAGVNQQSSQTDASSNRTMAAHLRHQSKKQASSSSSGPAWPATSRTPVLPVKSRQNKKQTSSSSSGPAWPAASRTPAQLVNTSHAWPPVTSISGSTSSSGQSRAVPEIVSVSSSQSTSSQIRPPSAATTSFASSLLSSSASGSSNRLGHSSSAPSLSDREPFDSSTDFPPVSVVAQSRKSTTDDKSVRMEGNVHTANKSLVEKMRAALGSDEDKFSAFKDISGQYRLGSMDVETYLTYVDQFGLSHLVLELAGLLPNPQKQKELTDAYNIHMASRENGWSNGTRNVNSSKKGKGKDKYVDSGNRSSVTNNLADNVISTVRALQSSYNAPEEEVEVLSKDGYRSARGKPAATVGTSPSQSSGPAELTKPKIQMESLYASGGTNQIPSNGSGKGKQRKKTSKFIRARLGDGSVEALLDLRNSDQEPDPDDAEPSSNVPVRGVWRSGGGQKLLSTKLGVKK